MNEYCVLFAFYVLDHINKWALFHHLLSMLGLGS